MINEGDKTAGLFIVLSGRMRVFFMSDYIRPREVSLGICGPGQRAGEMSLGWFKTLR
ncbi:MAG: hypothetical protein EBT78_09795 [Betaproteobacteria bacterium]|nr:hypothetical protein [Betaproteobacteria bacterium]NBT68036.1 hypothetical protein [Betaproteobacteria bacterium]NBY06853.1 hypothetical protein [Betaproteobacteria bacterium]